VRLRRKLLFGVCAMLGAGVVVLPAVAGSETTPTITAENYGASEHEHRWNPATATVGENGIVTLSNAGPVIHGVEWRSGPATPSCSGVPLANSAEPFSKKWSGTCSFSKPGTYVFWCTVHGPEMTGTITVNANGTTTMTMGSTPTSTAPAAPPAGSGSQTPTGANGPSPLASLLAGSASSAVKVPATQRGPSVHGSVDVSQLGAGGRLEVQLLAPRASLASAGHPPRVQVGRAVHSALRSGTVTFAVALDAKARHALRVHRRLALNVKILLTSPNGSPVTLTRAVVVRR